MPPRKSRKKTDTPKEPKPETHPISPRPPLPPRAPLPPLPPPRPLPPLPPLVPDVQDDDIIQQLPGEDLFHSLSPLASTPFSPEALPLSTILPSIPSCPLPSSPPKDFSSTSWTNMYDDDQELEQQQQQQRSSSSEKTVDDSINSKPKPTTPPLSPPPLSSPPDSEEDFIIRRRKRKPPRLIVPQPDYDYDMQIKATFESLFGPDETSEQEWDPTSPCAKLVGAGIKNTGNICFMSVILQCFTHTVPLHQGLRSCSHITPCGADGFCVLCALREHNDASLALSGGYLVPKKLVDNLSYFSPNFIRHQQEDAHEFMQCALNKVGRCFSDGEENLVQKVFGGRLISKLRCCNCGHCSDTYEPIIDISLEIENVNSLKDALESFTMVEKIDEKLTCASCGEIVSMEKQLLLYQTPNIAAFHLKRFKKDGDSVEKIDRRIYFTMELDLQPYTSGDLDDNVPLQYDLYAVVVHIGSTPNSGHYFCFVRSAPDKWHQMNDSQVTRANGELVRCQVAYMLFYARQGTPWFSSIMGTQKSVSDNVEKDEHKVDRSGGENDDDPMDGGKPNPNAVSDNVEKDKQMVDSSETETDPMYGRKLNPKAVSDHVEKEERMTDSSDTQTDDDPMDAYNDSIDVSGEESDARTKGTP